MVGINSTYSHNTRYETKMVIFFFLSWGFIFLDRQALSFLAPVIQNQIEITNTQLGQLGFVSTGCYAISSLVFGALSDKTGYRKKWLIPFMLITGIASGAGAFIHSYGQLLLVRALVGFGEGPILTLMMAMLVRASEEKRFGRNAAIVNTGVSVIAITLGPIIMTQLALHYNWQNAFLISSIPTFIFAIIIGLTLKEVQVLPQRSSDEVSGNVLEGKRSVIGNIGEILKYRNVVVCIIVCFFGMCSLWTLMLFAPTYLTQVSGVSVATMGILSSLQGIGNIVYCFMVPSLSDRYGRKNMLILFYILCVIAPMVMFIASGTAAANWAYVLFGGVPGAMSPLFMTIIPMESLPDHLRATANGLIMAVGEFFGGACYQILAGKIGDVYGLPVMMLVAAMLFLVNIIIIALFLKESNARVLAKKQVALKS